MVFCHYYAIIIYYHDIDVYIYTGWWYTNPSEKYDFVSWDDDIPNMMGKS